VCAERRRCKGDGCKGIEWWVTGEALGIGEMSAQKETKHVFRMAKVEANSGKDVVGGPCMRGQGGRLGLRLGDELNLCKDCCEEC